MSRGLGRVERAALEVLRQERRRKAILPRLSSFEITARVFGVPQGPDGEYALSEAQRASVRRALLSLRRRGLVFRCGFNRLGRARWMAREEPSSQQNEMPVRPGPAAADAHADALGAVLRNLLKQVRNRSS